MEATGFGMLHRLGIEMTNAIPGRPQGKGLMERAIKTLCEPAAKRLPTCTHRDMDHDAAKKVYKITRAHLKRYATAEKQKGKMTRLLPTWEEFKIVLADRIDEYNTTPHRALPKIEDSESGKRRHMSPDEMWRHFVDGGEWEPRCVPEGMEEELFMPSEFRIVNNGEVPLWNNRYFSSELADYHKDKVELRYDIWDATYVHVYTLEGRKICTAKRDANVIPYFPKSRIDNVHEKRETMQLKRLEKKLQKVHPGASVALPIETGTELMVADSVVKPAPIFEAVAALPEPQPAPVVRPAFMHDSIKFEWLMMHYEYQTDADKKFLADYAQTGRYKEMEELYEIKGIAYKPEPQSEQGAQ
jgi:putative transposase